MHVILFALGQRPQMEQLQHFRPTPLLCVADKPVIVHVLEYLVSRGATTFDIVLHYHPNDIEETLGDGRRWGVAITYHLVIDPKAALRPLRIILKRLRPGPFIVGSGDALPIIEGSLAQTAHTLHTPSLWYYPDGRWSEWACLDSDVFNEQAPQGVLDDMPSFLREGFAKATVLPLIGATTPDELLQSNIKVLNEAEHGLLLPSSARMVDPLVWVSRSVTLHPHVEVVPPVFIGEDCQIKDHAKIGPNAIIEHNSIIDSETSLDNTLVLSRSYVGEGLNLSQCVVDKNLLLNISHGTTVSISEDFILGELGPPPLVGWFTDASCRLLAALLLLVAAPVYVALRLFHAVGSRAMVCLPCDPNDADPKTFDLYSFDIDEGSYWHSLRNMPALFNIMRGDIRFIGVPPLPLRDLEAMPSHWRTLYCRSRGGVITLSRLDYGEGASADERYASDVFYAANMSLWMDTMIFLRWMLQKTAQLLRLGRPSHH